MLVARIERPPLRQKKPAPFLFRRDGESSISAASFFPSKPEPFHWVPVWVRHGPVCASRRLGEPPAAAAKPLPPGEVPQCARWGGEGRKARKSSSAPNPKQKRHCKPARTLARQSRKSSKSPPPPVSKGPLCVRRSLLHSSSAGTAKAPYPQPPSSFSNRNHFIGFRFGSDTGLSALRADWGRTPAAAAGKPPPPIPLSSSAAAPPRSPPAAAACIPPGFRRQAPRPSPAPPLPHPDKTLPPPA